MKITEIIKQKRYSLSFEVFPPKTWESFAAVEAAAGSIADLAPSYMSVTYGAGGGTSEYTVSIASKLRDRHGVTPLAHLTCVNSTRESVAGVLESLSENRIENILALRGDVLDPDAPRSYKYAYELVREIREKGDFCVGGACYPEKHPESPSLSEDIRHLKEKVDAGCDFLTTQMFFDNNIFYTYLYKLREAGITVPVIPGIMPITNGNQISRSIALSGANIPARFKAITDRFGTDPEAMEQAGIAYATDQIIDLFANGVSAVHVYSMNKPSVAASIKKNLSAIIGKEFL